MNRVCLSVLSVLLAVSCVDCLHEQDDGVGQCVGEKYPISVEVDLPYEVAGPKSSFTHDELNKITDLNIFVYHDGELLEEHSGYFTDMSSLMLSFPPDRNGFNIYMLGNVGRIQAPLDESDIGDICHVVDTYDDFRENGFPIANIFPDHLKGTMASFRLKRLIGQYDISLRPSAQDAEYVVKDVRLLNCALDVYPFGTDVKATCFARSGVYGEEPGGDVLTEEDLSRLNDGESVSLYFVENLQGELLPGNTDRTKKIPSSLTAIGKGLQDSCTYIEITADITTPAARYTDGKYRFYLGQNETTDFSIRRNTLYYITLDFTQNMVCEQEWRIEVGEPVVKSLSLSKDEVHIIRGVGDYILIDGPEVRINVDESDLDDKVCRCSLTDVVVGGKTYQKLSFSTDKEITGLYSWRSDYSVYAETRDVVLETVEKYNNEPLLSTTVKANVYDMAFPLLVRMADNGSSAPYQVEVLTPAPVDVRLNVSASVVADVEISGAVSSYTYSTASPVMGLSSDGFKSCRAAVSALYDTPGGTDGKVVYFRRMDVQVSGVETENCSVTDLYMGDGGKAYWGPGASLFPQKFSDLTADADISFAPQHSCSVSGCVKFEIMSGSVPLFRMAPRYLTCSSLYSTGMSNGLKWDADAYNSKPNLPFYIANGSLDYVYPVTLLNDSPKYLDDSGRKSIIYEVPGPGRDVFYPNGVSWGKESGGAPSNKHRFGYTAGMVKQFFGNVHTWQIYQGYDCDFYMTINGCTAWPGASKLSAGFELTYSL